MTDYIVGLIERLENACITLSQGGNAALHIADVRTAIVKLAEMDARITKLEQRAPLERQPERRHT